MAGRQLNSGAVIYHSPVTMRASISVNRARGKRFYQRYAIEWRVSLERAPAIAENLRDTRPTPGVEASGGMAHGMALHSRSSA